MTKMMTKFGIAPDSPILQGAIPSSLQSGIGITNDSSSQNSVGNNMQMAMKPPDYTSQGLPGHGNKGTHSTYENFASTSSTVDTPFGSRTEKVLSSFLQSPVLKGEESDLNVVVCNSSNCKSEIFVIFLHSFCLNSRLLVWLVRSGWVCHSLTFYATHNSCFYYLCRLEA